MLPSAPVIPDPTPTDRSRYVAGMSSNETPIHGTVAPGFEAVRTAFENNFATQDDVGASVAITIAGVPVVDLWGGTATFDGPDDDDAGVPGVEGDVAGRHDHQRVVDHQDHGGTVLSHARRPG